MRKRIHHRPVAGQALIEFLIIFWFAFSLLMLVIQISLMFNAHNMLKLAAFNAARAAIVTRSADGPERPVKLSEMKDAARKAAFLTILPVIPGMHARIGSFGDVMNLISSFPADASSLGLGALKGYGSGVIAAAVEYLVPSFFNVKFVKPSGDPSASDAEITSIPQQIEFDDTSKTNLADPNQNNLIKVVVEWNYPLVIPLADQIIYANTHTSDLLLGAIQTSPSTALEVALGQYQKRPVWEVGWLFRGNAFTLSSIFGFRVMLRQSYVMRMQWDRGPG
jgi:TadE-like protein